MSIKETIIQLMNEWAPVDTAESWDNVGLQLDTRQDISTVDIVLELNTHTWPLVRENRPEFIISHHPFIFNPIVAIGYQSWQDQVLRDLIANDVGLYVAHTNLDKADNAVSMALYETFDLSFVAIDGKESFYDGYGVKVAFKNGIYFEEISNQHDCLLVVPPENESIKTVCFMGGSGKQMVQHVINAGIDVFVTGELGYHDVETCKQHGVGVILMGHYESEIPVLQKISQRLSSVDATFRIHY